MKLFYDPLDKACKSKIGAIARGIETTFSLYLIRGGEDFFSADYCTLLLRRDGEVWEEFPMERIGERFALTLRFNETGLYFYGWGSATSEGDFCGEGSSIRIKSGSSPSTAKILPRPNGSKAA